MTGTFEVTKTRLILPMQLIYKQKRTCSLPKGVNLPDGFHLTFTDNLLLPYMCAKFYRNLYTKIN